MNSKRCFLAGSIIILLSAASLSAQQPLPQSAQISAIGTAAVFGAYVDGGALPLSYQWLFHGTNLTDNVQISGSQSNVLTISSVTLGNAGTYEVVVTNAYGAASAFATLTVLTNVTEGLTWQPAGLTYGMSLGPSQLNAVSSVPGNFAYYPANGSILNAGTNTLSMIFIPDNLLAYGCVTDTVSVAVSPAPLTVIAGGASRPYGTTNPTLTGSIIGLQNDDNITATYNCSATTNCPVGIYPIEPTLVDPNNRLTNYSVTLYDGALIVAQNTNFPTSYIFRTLAGQPEVAGINDGSGPAAKFDEPSGVAVDADGNIYVADKFNDTIRKVTSAGVVTTLAGQPGVSGANDGTGEAAHFCLPSGVAVDINGNIFVADQGNDTIRKITPTGVVTTLAGQPGVLGAKDGTGRAAQFCLPGSIAVDINGNIYVADTYNDTIRKVTSAGIVTTLAGQPGVLATNDGTGSAAQFFWPSGIAVDTNNNLYVADTYNNTIRKVTPVGTNWVVTTLAGKPGVPGTNDGAGSAAQFSAPSNVAVDTNGNIFVGDRENDTIRKVTPAGVVTTLAGKPGVTGTNDGTGIAAQFDGPWGVAVDTSGNLYVADTYNNTIRVGSPLAAPWMQTGQPSGSSFNYTWSSISGQLYQIQSTTTLIPPNWTNLGDAIIATNSTMTISESIGVHPQQFYRVVLLP